MSHASNAQRAEMGGREGERERRQGKQNEVKGKKRSEHHGAVVIIIRA